jgi:hypothetical protein
LVVLGKEKAKKMPKLNHIQYAKAKAVLIDESYSLSALEENSSFENLLQEYKQKFGYTKLKTFSFTKEGFLGLLLELKDSSIAISLGESQALIDAAFMYESLGFQIIWLDLEKDGKVNLSNLKNQKINFLFLSSYVMDTFVLTNLENIKEQTSAKIISNATANHNSYSDIVYFDPYKLTGFNTNSVILFDDETFTLLPIGQIDSIACKLCFDSLLKNSFNKNIKALFLERLKTTFKDNIYFFVEPKDTLEYTLHFGLKGIKARELIRTLALSEIYITNGEGCSLGLSKPSRIIQSMGYDEMTSRNAISLSFVDEIDEKEIDKVIRLMYLKYKQIHSFN